MKNYSKTYISIISILILISSLAACEKPTEDQGATSDSQTVQEDIIKKEIRVQKVKKEAIYHDFSYLGTAIATQEISIPARASGVVEKIYVKEGDFVNKNDILVDLKDPNGANTTQISLEISKNALKNAKDSLETAKQKTNENIKASQISLSTSQQRLVDTQETLKRTQSQNEIILRSSEGQLQNLKNTLFRTQTSLNLSERQLGLSNENIEDLNEISFENIYKSLELATLSTLPSIILSLENSGGNLPHGLNSLNNELDNLESKVKRADEDDFDDLEDLILDLEEYVKDFLVYLDDEDFYEDTSLSSITGGITATLKGLDSQLQNLNTVLKNSDYSVESLDINHDAQIKGLLDQIESIQDQIKLQELSLENTRQQTQLGEHSIGASINLLRKEIESKESALKLTEIGKDLELEQSENLVENAEYQLEQAKLGADYLEVKATTSGKISNLPIEKGQVIGQQSIIASIFQENKDQVEIFINPEDIKNFDIGNKAYLTTKNNDKKYLGEISNINPTADISTHLVLVTIELIEKPEGLIPNSVVNIEIPVLISETEIFIPLKNVFIRESGNYVFVEKNGKAKKQIIETGDILKSNIIVKSGLEEGDNLIIEGLMDLKDGEYTSIQL